MESLFDLPAHIFFVHLPVVAAPLAALATITLLARGSWAARYGLWPLGISLVAFVGTLLAYSSGERFAVHVEGFVDISRHQSLASTMRIFSGAHLLAVAALVWWARRERPHERTPTLWAISGVATVVSILLAVWTIRTGHEGAKVTWSGVL